MTNQKIVLHNRIPKDLDDFVEELAKKPEYHNKTHVVTYALEKLREQLNDKRR
jgi:Arc/MetJ-type ribon-helix-helix transcriptional regulator